MGWGTFSSLFSPFHRFTASRWFCWAPVVSQWPNRANHSSPVCPSDPSIYFNASPLPSTNVHVRSSSIDWAAKCICKYFEPVHEKLASPFLKLLYFENVNLHSGFPCGVGGLIRSISVRLVPRQPRKKIEGGQKKEKRGREGEMRLTDNN